MSKRNILQQQVNKLHEENSPNDGNCLWMLGKKKQFIRILSNSGTQVILNIGDSFCTIYCRRMKARDGLSICAMEQGMDHVLESIEARSRHHMHPMCRCLSRLTPQQRSGSYSEQTCESSRQHVKEQCDFLKTGPAL